MKEMLVHLWDAAHRHRKPLLTLGAIVLGKPVHYHLFRHSSATYYANKLNRSGALPGALYPF